MRLLRRDTRGSILHAAERVRHLGQQCVKIRARLTQSAAYGRTAKWVGSELHQLHVYGNVVVRSQSAGGAMEGRELRGRWAAVFLFSNGMSADFFTSE